jgi:hypothetical protein
MLVQRREITRNFPHVCQPETILHVINIDLGQERPRFWKNFFVLLSGGIGFITVMSVMSTMEHRVNDAKRMDTFGHRVDNRCVIQ